MKPITEEERELMHEVDMCNRVGQDYADRKDPSQAARWFKRAHDARRELADLITSDPETNLFNRGAIK